MKLNPIALLFFLVLLSGCVTTSNLPKNEPAMVSPQETVFVIGVQPRYRVALAKGRVDGTKWSRDSFSVATTNSFPDDGYIVVKVPSLSPPEWYGIAQILPEGIGVLAPRYMPCIGQGVVAFQAPSGKIVYVGDIEYKREGDKLKFNYAWRPEAAKKFVSSSYSALSDRLELSEGSIFTESSTTCDPTTIYVQITRTSR
ncbi:hypothetical protein [Azonexus fungiphilus]|nr:hypothetical protein [Azonexus fungiphilus]